MHLSAIAHEMVSQRSTAEENVMPLVDIQVIEGVFEKNQKK